MSEIGYPPEVVPALITPEEAARELDQKLGKYVVEMYSPYKARVDSTEGLDSRLNLSMGAIKDYIDELLDERFALNVVLGTAKEEEITPKPEAPAPEAKELTKVRFQLSTEPVPEERDHWTVLIDHYNGGGDDRKW